MHAEAVALLFAGDSLARASARDALELMLDTTAGIIGEDPPRLVSAALATTLAKAWAVTGAPRYREIGRDVVRRLADDLPNDVMFADQEAFLIEHLLIGAGTFGEAAAAKRARAALDALLRRNYAHGWGVRHAIASTPPGLLRDQLQVAAASLAAYRFSDDSHYLDVAVDLVGLVEQVFGDSLGGYYDLAATSPGGEGDGRGTVSPPLGDRTKHVFDDVLPGPNAQAALLFARLAQVTGDPSYRRRARTTLESFAGAMSGAGVRSTTFLAAARETLQLP